jgi:dTDP-4-dehydrorhamnose 3,5-epimerase
MFTETILSGSYIVDPSPIQDERGVFMRTFCKEEFSKIGFSGEWVQLNHSVSYAKGTLRGMHYQKPPYGEVKMVKCIRGMVWDVIVDIRRDSPTFLKWTGVELSADNKRMLFIPIGFAHGFQTLAEHTELIYHHSDFFNPQAEAGLLYNDPALSIQWPLKVASISERDQSHSIINNDFKGI